MPHTHTADAAQYRPTLYLGPDLPHVPPPPWLGVATEYEDVPDSSGISGLSASAAADASAQVHSNETSFPERPFPSYNEVCRSRDKDEWKCVRNVLSSLRPQITDKRIYRYDHCLDRAWFYREKTSGKVAVFSGACRDRFCPVCSNRRSYDVSNKVKEWISLRHDVRFATFTLRSSDTSLDVQITALYSAFAKLRMDPKIRKGLAAGIWFFQCTFNLETGQWHPHLHCVCCGSYVDKIKLSDAWHTASGDSYIVDIRYVRDVAKVAAYVARYAARPYRLLDVPAEKRVETVLCFWSRRLFGTWGKLELRPKIKRPRADLSAWECVGSWSYVIACQEYDWKAMAIMMAYQARTPLAAGVSIYRWDRAVDWPGTKEIDIDPPPPSG